MTTPTDLIAIVPVHGPVPDNAIMFGSQSMLMENIIDSQARNDAIKRAAQAVVDAEEAKELAAEAERLQEMAKASTVRMITDTINRVASRLDAFIARRDAEEEEAEAQRIQDELAALPDPDDPGVHENTGDLHALSTKTEEELELPVEDQVEFEQPGEPAGAVFPQPVAVEFDEV
jgi:hypothetical protein